MLSDNVLARHVWDPRLQSPYCKQNSARRRGELYTLEHSQTSFLTAYLAHEIQGNPGADLTAGSPHRHSAGSSPWTPTCEPLTLTRQQCDWSIAHSMSDGAFQAGQKFSVKSPHVSTKARLCLCATFASGKHEVLSSDLSTQRKNPSPQGK